MSARFVSGERVAVACHADGCSKDRHEGTITGLTVERALDMHLPIGAPLTDNEPVVGVLLDDRPGVIEFVHLANVAGASGESEEP